MEYDTWKKENYTPTKDKLSKMARTYDRFFFNDTILEVKTAVMDDKTAAMDDKTAPTFGSLKIISWDGRPY